MTTAPDTGHAPRRTMWALILLVIFINAAVAGSRTALPLFAIHLGASTVTVGILMATMALVPAMVAMRMGRLLDRMGPRRPMIVGSLGVLLALGCGYGFASLPGLFVCTVTLGTFSSLFFMAHTQAIGKLASAQDRTGVLSMSAMGFSVSSFSGPMAAGFAIDHLGHANALLVLAAAPTAALTALLFRLLPISDATHRSFTTGKRGKVMDFLRTPAMRRVYVVGMISNSAWDCLNLMIPVYGHAAGLTATAIGIVLGAFSLGTFSIRVLLPILARRLKPWRLLATAFAVCVLGYTLIPFTTTAGVLVAFAFTIGLGLGASQPLVTSLLFDAAPPARLGEALGLRTAMVNVGQTVFPLTLGGLGSLLGVGPIFWGMAMLLASGVGMAWRVRK